MYSISDQKPGWPDLGEAGEKLNFELEATLERRRRATQFPEGLGGDTAYDRGKHGESE
jgi:hypothetical protein